MEDSEECDRKGVEVRGRSSRIEVELTTKKLHSKKGEDKDKEEEQEQKRNDTAHRIEQRDHEVSKAGPIFGDLENSQESKGT